MVNRLATLLEDQIVRMEKFMVSNSSAIVCLALVREWTKKERRNWLLYNQNAGIPPKFESTVDSIGRSIAGCLNIFAESFHGRKNIQKVFGSETNNNSIANMVNIDDGIQRVNKNDRKKSERAHTHRHQQQLDKQRMSHALRYELWSVIFCCVFVCLCYLDSICLVRFLLEISLILFFGWNFSALSTLPPILANVRDATKR